MSIYSAADIVGKTLIAKVPVMLKRTPQDSAPSIFTAAPGASVGTVFSYIAPGVGNKRLYWMFKDSSGRSYYAEHAEGRFDIKAIQSQGVLTADEKKDIEDKKNEGVMGWLERNIKTVAFIIGAGVVGKELIKRGKS